MARQSNRRRIVVDAILGKRYGVSRSIREAEMKSKTGESGMDEPYRTRRAEKLHRTTSQVLEGGINHTTYYFSVWSINVGTGQLHVG